MTQWSKRTTGRAPTLPAPPVPDRDDELRLLFAINQILVGSLDPLEVLEPILATLVEGAKLDHALLVMVDRQSGALKVEAAARLTPTELECASARLESGPIGEAFQKKSALMVPLDDDEHPLFVDIQHEQPFALLIAPIMLGDEMVGSISGDFPTEVRERLSQAIHLMSTAASMVAQAVRLRQRASEERAALRAENARLRHELKERFQPGNLIGASKAMREAFDQIARVSPSDASVLIRGESGVGKELVASSIHYSSKRSSGPFVKVNCAALPATLLESELFGHEKGAFTGALQDRAGRFELADGGTLFLDEIGDFPPTVQIVLLRFLQEREFERVGSTQVRKSNVRIIAATNACLEDRVKDGSFREDLYYRLNVFPIHVPALRDRRVDIAPLADHFVKHYAGRNEREITRISTPAIRMLTTYDWPGNVRELENCIERAVLQSEDKVLRSHHLPPTLQTSEATETQYQGTLAATLARVEYELILDALKATQGNRAEAARQIGITERQMGLRVARYKIDTRTLR